MRFFTVVDFQYWAMAFFLGLVAIVLTYLGWASYPKHRFGKSKEEVEERMGHELFTGHDASRNPIAPFLIFVYMLIVVWALAYVYYIGVRGPSY
jgi:hypothetical protein